MLRMNFKRNVLVVAAVSAVLAACSSGPDRNDDLDQARVAVERAQNHPDAGKYAADEVQAANDALRKAEELADDKKSKKVISEQAYLASRHAQTAEQQISRGQAEAATAKAEEDRQRVLVQAREQEAAARQRESQARELEAQAAKARAEQDADRARADAEMLQQQLRDLQARETDRGLVLTLGDVLFDTGRATLKPGAHSTVQRLGDFLRKAPERTVTIEGHTDSMGEEAYNQMLSESRAGAVKEALVGQGIDPARILVVGKGESTPVASNGDNAGRQQNRRVEIVISNPVEVVQRP